ncbi:DUF4097 family beta strand repeat-containing protein [Puia sp.]|jgi:hypothetical protein|uniref:DUF4097 family beta strand repeat-containing protein n=1 Tax=Puia sp. TaxID=2045100 RepID=UPI002F40C17C
MKQMKYSFLLIASLCIGFLTRAQDYKISVGDMKDAKLILEDFTGELPIEGYAGNEIIVSGGVHQNFDRAKGLKAIYAAGTDNTGVALYMEKSGNHILLRCLLPITQSAEYRLKVPESLALEITRDCAKSGTTTITNIRNEVEFKGCHDITLSKVTGPIVVSTISGNVNVAFTEIARDKPISISSVSGEVDVTLPAKTPFSVEMGTVSGNMFSDFDFPPNDKDMRRVGGGKLRADFNGGGTAVRLNSVSGNVYLRKG